MPSRRRLLSASALLTTTGLGGCLRTSLGGFGGADEGGSETVLTFEPVDAADVGQRAVVAENEWTAAQRDLLGDDPGSDAVAYGFRPFHEGAVLLADGVYYTLSVNENGTGTVTRPVLQADPVDSADGDVGDLRSLSPADLSTLKCATAADAGDGDDPCVVHGGEGSAFWPEPSPEYVEVGGDVYRLAASERSVTLERFEYSFERVAESHEAFADYYAENLLAADFDDRSLTGAEREILDAAATEGRYRETPPYSDSFQAIVDAVRSGSLGRSGYVRYDGAFYLASVRQVWAD